MGAKRLLLILPLMCLAVFSCKRAPKQALQPQDYTNFVKAVMNDDVATTKSLLAKGLDVKPFNTTKINGLSLMNLVSSVDMARLLVDNGVSPELTDSNGSSLLMLASSQGKTDLVRYLLEKKVDVTATTSELQPASALDMAAMQGHADIAQLLLKAGANVNGAGSNSALGYAITQKHIETVKVLLAAGARTDWNDVRMAFDSDSGKQIEEAVLTACRKKHQFAIECPSK